MQDKTNKEEVISKERRYIKEGGSCIGIEEGEVKLVGVDGNGSIIWQDNKINNYSPYGAIGGIEELTLGYNGERIDPESEEYNLGNGYRTYNPELMRFNSPDSLSPFEAGGINPYVYCQGDPINNIDPSGHLSWQAIAGIAMGAIGLGLAAFTAGSSIVAAGGVVAALNATTVTALVMGGLGVVSDITGIVGDALEESDPSASSILGWVSLGTGVASMLGGLAAAKAAKHAGKRGRKLPRTISEEWDIGTQKYNLPVQGEVTILKTGTDNKNLYIVGHGGQVSDVIKTNIRNTNVHYYTPEGTGLKLNTGSVLGGKTAMPSSVESVMGGFVKDQLFASPRFSINGARSTPEESINFIKQSLDFRHNDTIMSTFLRGVERSDFDVLAVSNSSKVSLSSIYTHVINPLGQYTDVHILTCRTLM